MTNIRAVLAGNIKAYRGALGLSQSRLAEKAGTSAHYIGMIETRNKFPSPEMLERIAAALGVDTIDMFSTKLDLPGIMKTGQKAALEDLRGLIDEKLKVLENGSGSG